MKKLVKIVGILLLIGVCAYVAYTAIQYHRQRAGSEKRIHDIRQIGAVWVLLAEESGTNTLLNLAGVRAHLPAGFPLERYELLPLSSNALVAAFVREAVPDGEGQRAVLFTDGRVLFQR
jgi:hypothetical protein